MALGAFAVFCTALSASDSTITAPERAKAIQWLGESQKEFLGLLENLSDAAWSYKPAPDRWSVGEAAEHIMHAEGVLFGMLEKALAAPPNPEWDAKTSGKSEFLERVMVDRSRKALAPESVQPRGSLSRAEILSRYQQARARTLKFAEETQLALKAHTADHPFKVFNTLNAYQWLIYIPLHNMRHNQQIAEVKAASGFPQ